MLQLTPWRRRIARREGNAVSFWLAGIAGIVGWLTPVAGMFVWMAASCDGFCFS